MKPVKVIKKKQPEKPEYRKPVKPIKTLADAMEYYQGKVAECDEKNRKEALKCAATS